jgi:signal peptidase II
MEVHQQHSLVRLPFYRDWLLVPLVGLVYILDQLTKHWAESTLCPYRSIPDDGPFRLICSYNTGSAFGLFPDQTFLLIIASFVGVGVLLFVYRSHPFPNLILRISLGLQLGGAAGNLTDRLRFGQVTDFVQLGFWPVFNLADASIVVGVVLLVWVFMFSGQGAKSSPSEGIQEAESLETTGVVHQVEVPGEEDGP